MGLRATIAGGAALLACLALVGCSSVADGLTAAARSAGAATSSASLAVQLFDDRGATGPATDTELTDTLEQLESASTDAVEASPSTGDESSSRATTLSAIRTATDAVVAARATLASGGHPDPSPLRSAARTLQELGR